MAKIIIENILPDTEIQRSAQYVRMKDRECIKRSGRMTAVQCLSYVRNLILYPYKNDDKDTCQKCIQFCRVCQQCRNAGIDVVVGRNK